MAKRKPKKPTGIGAIKVTKDTSDKPSFTPEAITCLGSTMYNVRQVVQATAIKRANGKFPVSLAAVKVALLEHDLGWALEDAKGMKEVGEQSDA